MPRLTFVFGDKKYSLTSKDYILTTGLHQTSQEGKQEPQERCLSGIIPMKVPGQHEQTWVFGDLFLSKFYLSFDLDNLRVGIGYPRVGASLEERVKKLSSIKEKHFS